MFLMIIVHRNQENEKDRERGEAARGRKNVVKSDVVTSTDKKKVSIETTQNVRDVKHNKRYFRMRAC